MLKKTFTILRHTLLICLDIIFLQNVFNDKKNWFKKNKNNIFFTLALLLFCTTLSTFNSTVAFQKLAIKKLNNVDKLMQNQTLYLKKINSQTNAPLEINLSKKAENNKAIITKAVQWNSFITNYLSTQPITQNSFKNSLTRNKKKLESAIFRYNTEAKSYNTLIKKPLHRPIKRLLKMQPLELIPVTINTEEYIIYE